MLTNIVAADEDEIAAIGESMRPVDEWSGMECRDIDTAKIATLHCVLTGDEFGEAIACYEPAYVAFDGAIVLRLADPVMERLSMVDDEALELIGAELAATEEYEQEQWAAEDVQSLLIELGELARLADSQGQALFVWIHPLPA